MRVFPQKRSVMTKKSVFTFKGFDRRLKSSEKAFREMTNMSGMEKNCVSVRGKRGFMDMEANEIYSMVSTDVLIDGVIRENAFIVDTGNRLKAFYYEAGVLKRKDIMNTTSFTTGKNKMITSGGYLYFFPDKKYINLMNTRESGSLEATVDLNAGTTETATGTYFYETTLVSTDQTGKNNTADSGYIRIRSERCKDLNGVKGDHVNYHNFAVKFRVGDTVKLEGAPEGDGLHRIVYIPDDYSYIVVRGVLSGSNVTADGIVTVSRNVPDMDYVVAAGNRLWGCRYGVNDNGEPVNEIYASAQGDAKNWNTFDGVSTDSYVASVGQDGVFTGAVVYQGDPLFFKEDAVIRVYGSVPSDFTILTSNIRGIEKGSSDSAVIVNDTLYYKTYSGIVAYSGGMPYNVDGELGDVRYSEAVAGCLRERYYVSLKNADGEYELLVYDTENESWYREDTTRVRNFCRCGDELYMLTGEEGQASVVTVFGSGNAGCEDEVCWECVTGDLGTDVSYRKYVTRLEVRIQPLESTLINVDISYDGEDVWHRVGEFSDTSRLISVPVIPRRCHSYRLKLWGTGRCKILSMVRNEYICGENRKEEL